MRLRVTAAVAVVTALVIASAAAAGTGHPSLSWKTGLEGIRHFEHVVVLTEENENESVTFGPGSPATYLNSLISQGVFLPNYYGTGHVSLDNYLAMVSGQPGNALSNSDCLTVSLWTCAHAASAFGGGVNLADQLEKAGWSWNSWMDGTSVACFHGPYRAADTTPDPYQGDSTAAPAYNFADRHNPFIYFTDFIENQQRCDTHQRPFSQLQATLADSSTWTNDALPAFSFITPDTCDDGHDNPCAGQTTGGLTAMDAWLRSNLPPLLHYLDTHDGLLVINFDESNPTSPPDSLCTTCASGGAGGRTGALLLGDGIAARTISTGYDHYCLLRTIEDSFGINDYLGLAQTSTPMTDALSSRDGQRK